MACRALRETGALWEPAPKPITSPVPAPTSDDDTAEIMDAVGTYLTQAVELIKVAAGVPAKEQATAQAMADAAQAKAAADSLAAQTVTAQPVSVVSTPVLGVPLWLWAVGGVGLFLVFRKKR